GEDAVLDLDVHVLLGQAGEVGRQDEVLLGLDEVPRGNTTAHRAAHAPGGRVEDGAEQTVHLVLQGRELTKRLPTHDGHSSILHVNRCTNLTHRTIEISVVSYQVCELKLG